MASTETQGSVRFSALSVIRIALLRLASIHESAGVDKNLTKSAFLGFVGGLGLTKQFKQCKCLDCLGGFMPTLEIESDVYEFLRMRADFGESPSAVLRRLHRLPNPPPHVGSAGSGLTSEPREVESPLAAFVRDERFRLKSATDKYLGILGFAFTRNPILATKVLGIGGRRRSYFAKSREEIARSGKSTHPRPIPGTEYWAMTNADTRQKCQILRKALKVLGFSDEDIAHADRAVF
jgi:negative modulator of initiation of replication